MINELVIHLGDTKTGSTSIQRALAHKVCQAPGVAIAYPTRNNHIGLAKTLSTKSKFDEQEPRFNRVYKVFMESTADIGVVSAEHFQFVDPHVLADAIKTHWPELEDRIRLVAYVRPHGDKILSDYSERVKLGTEMRTLERFAESVFDRDWMQYTERFTAWRKVFGTRFELRPFVRNSLYQGDAVSDFCKYLFQSEDFEITGTVAANPSSTLSQLALLREAHKVVKHKLGSRNGVAIREAEASLGRIIAEHMQKHGLGQNGGKLYLPQHLVERVRSRFTEDAKTLDAAFFDDTPISDALARIHLKATSEKQSLEAVDHFEPDVINSVRVFANVLADILAEIPLQLDKTIAGIRAKKDVT